ncbi:unnamed protein product [Darwinula stevensoni]|uniref:GB1/RHD3-type G domain-containing protein n=1 Tax=Darwinula stevensoni TaxID=69355 RepID=A0A7R8X6I2_9CRUS|nr:unnamed protein product [Darwinula stevensoni]CAG0885792.1 unnamed protein product [Darwinula stevensoni]
MNEDAVCERAICVVEHNEYEGKDSYLLKEDRLRRMLLQADCRDKPVAVVSIAGGARRGKSFLLSLFLRYLRAQGSEDWLDDEDTPIAGFAWKMSAKRVTTGIHIWDELFTLRLPNGEEACVLLMDTEGTFDCEESLAHSVTIFALSTLLSSVQIYNLKENINMDDLLHLQVVLSACEIMGCFLMPYPGDKVAGDPHFTGSLTDILEDFKDQLRHLVPQLLSPENLVLKTIAGNPITCKQLFKCFKSYIGIFNNLEEILEPKSIFEATAEVQHRTAHDEAVDHYTQRMDRLLAETPVLAHWKLQRFHAKLRIEAIERFTSSKKMGGKELSERYQSLLDEVSLWISTFQPRMWPNGLSNQYALSLRYIVEVPKLSPTDVYSLTPFVLRMRALDENPSGIGRHSHFEVASSARRPVSEKHQRYAKASKAAKGGGDSPQNEFQQHIHELHEKYEMEREAREEPTRRKLMEAATAALKKYGEDMAEVMRAIPLPTGEELRFEHEQNKTRAIRKFRGNGKNADEELFRQYQQKLEKCFLRGDTFLTLSPNQDVESEATHFFKERQSKESTADRDPIEAVQSAVWSYRTQLGHTRGGAYVSEEELESERRKFYRDAIHTFRQRTQNTICPYLLGGHQDDMIRRLDEQYKKCIERREPNEGQAETELRKAKENAMKIYNDQMSKLLVELMSEEKLNNFHASYRRQTIESFEETSKKHPHLAKKHADDLESLMSSEHERYKAFRKSQEDVAAAALEDAVERSLTHYGLQMSCLCGGRDAGEGDRQGDTGSSILTEEVLLERHEKYLKEAMEIFWATGAQSPRLAENRLKDLQEVTLIF